MERPGAAGEEDGAHRDASDGSGQAMRMLSAELFGHGANILFAAAYLVRDIFWLRAITVFGCLALIVYNYVVPSEPLWVVIYWDSAFVVINAVQIAVLIREKRSVVFSEEERALKQTVFRALSPADFMKLLRVGLWRDVDDGSILVRQDSDPGRLLFLRAGTVDVVRDGAVIAQLESGSFIGEMSFVTGHTASATVTSRGAVRLLEWPKTRLSNLLDRSPGIRMVFQSILGVDMADKLGARDRAAPVVNDSET